MKRRLKGTGSVFPYRGKWCAKIKGKKYTANTRAEAQAICDSQGRTRLTGSVTVAEYSERFFKRAIPRLRWGTVRLYSGILTNHVIPGLGQMKLGEVTIPHVKDLLTRIRQTRSPKTVLNIRGVLTALFTEAMDDQLIQSNPTRFRADLNVKKRKLAPKAMSVTELRDFLRVAEREEPVWSYMWRLMAFTGLRPGEAMSLQWEDVQWATRIIRVARSWSNGVIEPPKTGFARAVEVPNGVMDVLRGWDVDQKANALARGEPRPVWIWPSSVGTPIHRTYMTNAFKNVCVAAKLKAHFTPHCLRHTFATQALLDGAPIQWVQRQLGHSTIQQTVDLYGSWQVGGRSTHADQLETNVGEA